MIRFEDSQMGALLMGELDPRYKIRSPLRCDGIGRLDCAEDTESGVRMAVRWLPRSANGDAAARACEELPMHPTLPRIRQTGQVGSSAFVAMDFPEGQLLSTVLEERLNIEHIIRVGAQLADCLATIHSQNVVHGELSTESVLLVGSDKAFLWDMPLVIANRLTDRRGENRLMQKLVSIAAYLAPERAQGGGASQAGDIYALGVVLCAAAGAPLPNSATTLGVVHQVANGGWAPRVPNAFPEPWNAMIQRMVSVDPTKRPTAMEVEAVFSQLPKPGMLPTVPEMQVVRLPPQLMAAAEAATKKIALDDVPFVDPTSVITADPDEAVPRLDLSFKQAAMKTMPMSMPAPVAPEVQSDPVVTAVAPVPVPLTTPGVPLLDTVTVSSEMARAGAKVLVPASDSSSVFSKRTALYLMGAVVICVVLLLVGVMMHVSGKSAAVTPVVKPTVAPVVEQVVPVVTEPQPDEDLIPLKAPRLAKPKAKVDAAAAKPAPTPADFGFLDEGSELKKPEL